MRWSVITKFRVEVSNDSKYFKDDEESEAIKYFNSRAMLGLPCSLWVVHYTLYGDYQTCLRKTM